MNKLKTKNIYKANNVTLDIDNMTAFSYGWWQFVTKKNGKVFFNSYAYSSTTRRHQSKVLQVMQDNDIKIDHTFTSRVGFQDSGVVESGIELYEAKILELTKAIDKPRSQAAKNLERAKTIKEYKSKIKEVRLYK